MSGGNNNVTISHPGSHWQTLWPSSFGNFQLDIVGFLAILGEGSITANAQVQALSWLFYLPRLIPAPQALIWPSRPETLPGAKGFVTGVRSGNWKDSIHHIAHVLLGEDLKPNYSVRCVRIKKKEVRPHPFSKFRALWTGEPRGTPVMKRAGTQSPTEIPPPVTARVTGPLAWVTLLGFALSVVMLVASLVYGDGMSVLATILLSVLSTLVGLGNKWTLKLAKAHIDSEEEVVIRYPGGSFLIVKCDEVIARELYFAPEEIDYNLKSLATYRLISLVGTLLLMLGVIALANARLELQFAWAGAYIIINIAYWIVAALPPHLHWDFSYEIVEEGLSSGPENLSFTDALWKAILFTQSTKWVHLNNAAPRTEVWDKWLEKALNAARDAKSMYEALQDPKFPNKCSREGIVWVVPNWGAKAEWDALKKKSDETDPKPTFDRANEAEPQEV